MKTKEFTLEDLKNIAVKMTKRAAEVKDSKLTAAGRRMKEQAKELAAGRGYFIGTYEDANKRGADFPTTDTRKHMFAYDWRFHNMRSRLYDIDIVAIR